MANEPAPTSSPTNSGPTPGHRRLRRRIAITASIVLAIILIVLFLLPIWASTERGRAFVLEQINKKLNGTVDCDRWRLSWFRSIKIEGLTLNNADGKRIFECREINTGLSLWDYFWGDYAVGTTHVYDPQLTLNKYPDGTTDLDHIFGAMTAVPSGRLQTFFESLSGLIKIEHGNVALWASDTAEPLRFQSIEAEIPIASPQTHIHFSIHAGTETSTNLIAEGDLPPLETWLANPYALLTDIDLHAKNLPVEALMCWLGVDHLYPQDKSVTHWEQAFGSTIKTLSYSSNSSNTVSGVDFSAYATAGSMESHLQIQPRTGSMIVALPAHDYFARINVRMAPAVIDWLKYVNPLFAQAQADSGMVTLSLTDAYVDLSAAQQTARTSAQLFCNNIALQPGGLLADILSLASHNGSKTIKIRPLHVTIPPLRFMIAQQQISYDNLTITLPPARPLNFSGAIDLNGLLHLRLTLKPGLFADPTGALDSGTINVPVIGTVDEPKLELQ